MKVFSVGHATFRIELDGKVIFTDPWFTTSGIVFHLFTRRLFPIAVDADSVERCDVMLISHNHIDHVSREAFALAQRLGSVIMGPRGVIQRARKSRVARLCELRPGQRETVEGISITAVPAMHPLSRDAVGFLLEGERSIYFSGDTLFDWSIVDFLRGKRLDIAMLQVSCSFYTWLRGADGMDIKYAEELAKALRPKHVIPMHFDCAGKYLDLVGHVRVRENSLDVEDALDGFSQRLAAAGISCEILYPGRAFEL